MATIPSGETVEIATVGGKLLEGERREGEIEEGGGGGGRDKLGSGVRGRDSPPPTPTPPPPADEDDNGGGGGGGGRLLLCFTTSPPPPIRSSPEEAIQGVVVKVVVVVVVVKGKERDLVENGELTDPPSSAIIRLEFPLKNISEVSSIKFSAPVGDDDDDDGSDSLAVDNGAKRDFDLGLAPLLRGGFNPPTSSPTNRSLKI